MCSIEITVVQTVQTDVALLVCLLTRNLALLQINASQTFLFTPIKKFCMSLTLYKKY